MGLRHPLGGTPAVYLLRECHGTCGVGAHCASLRTSRAMSPAPMDSWSVAWRTRRIERLKRTSCMWAKRVFFEAPTVSTFTSASCESYGGLWFVCRET